MSYYSTCPDCGAHLDPGERCDCQDEKRAAQVRATTWTAIKEREHAESKCIISLSVHEIKEGEYTI